MENILSQPSFATSLKRRRLRWLAAGVTGLALAGLLIWSAQQPWFPIEIKRKPTPGGQGTSAAAETNYWAVYLTSGQVYFGKLINGKGPYLVLEDVFYFRQPAVPHEGNIRLLKLGNEIHGPQDQVMINRDHAVFVEQMTEDSEIVKAIVKFKATGSAT